MSKVIFICTGNTCRSPMAAAVLNHYGAPKGIFAFSRGIYADVGAPISENAAKALENKYKNVFACETENFGIKFE